MKHDVIYADLSYKIVGGAFNVYNALGYGHPEKSYQKALAIEFLRQDLTIQEQVYAPLVYREKVVGKYFLDFLIDDKIVVEIKRGDKFTKQQFDQVLEYLRVSKLKLAILICFGREGVIFKRVVNFNS